MPCHHHSNIQHHSEALLASLPGGGDEKVSVNAAGLNREELRQEATRKSISELRSVPSSRVWITTNRYCTIGNSMDRLERYLHNIWHLYYQAGRYLSHESPEHDAIVLDIPRIQGKGLLSRLVKGVPGVDLARN
ncbi:hypothetical protein BO79DRAFT_203525 [Aspergillus costaricaensis CBS 115574]|uniref:Uncharacterized protein n=1 Tax=Aspergillus costaricaensis CBS 115574 TaxID=1448317 RepID=A0ACD1I2J8_9EURO|nr:hypothetical protein BO79DRAFT_203525 [Aspergillus costaricaensis CBS 115574]RAK83980.1 hypothetical protein BO79DRAFT_203525 [Aspergillus costaricaensis CBS 115574]